jgi:hypothetical protein
MGKKSGKNGVVTLDASDPKGTAERLLENMSEAERAEVLKKYGAKSRGNGKAESEAQYQDAMQRLSKNAFSVCAALGAFPKAMAVTFVRSPDNEYTVTMKQVRNKYKPREKSSE